MNTLADAVTLFTDDSVQMVGTVRPGPTLYEWAILAAHAEAPDARTAEIVAAIPAPRRAGFAEAPVRAGFASDYAGELGALRPESHPSRSTRMTRRSAPRSYSGRRAFAVSSPVAACTPRVRTRPVRMPRNRRM